MNISKDDLLTLQFLSKTNAAAYELLKSVTPPHVRSADLIPIKKWIDDHSKKGGGYFATKYENPNKDKHEHHGHTTQQEPQEQHSHHESSNQVPEKTAKKLVMKFYKHCHDDTDFLESMDKLGLDYHTQTAKDMKELLDVMPRLAFSKDDKHNMTVAAARNVLLQAIKNGFDPFKVFPEKNNDASPYSKSTAPDFFKPAEEKWDSSIQLDDKCAVRLYTDSQWTYLLNSFMRGLEPPPKFRKSNNGKYYKDDLEGITTIAEHLEAAINEFELTEPIMVSRELDRYATGVDLFKSFKNASNGVFQERSFASTSPVLGSFKTDQSQSRITLRLKLPKGKGIGAWVKSMSGFPDENEFLLQRGCQFKITSDLSQIDPQSRHITIDCELCGIAPVPLEQIIQEHKDKGTIIDGYNTLENRKDIDEDMSFAENYFVYSTDDWEDGDAPW